MRIAIASGKGGTGKTFVSVNLFHTLRKMGRHASLIDCDVEVPNALAFFSASLQDESEVTEYRPLIDAEKCIFCGRCVDYCEYHALFPMALSRSVRLLENLCHGCGACAVACKSGAIQDSVTVAGKVSTYSYSSEVCLAEGCLMTGHPSAVPLIKAAVKSLDKIDFEYTLYDSPPGTSCPFIQTVVSADYVLLVTEPTPFGLSDLKQAVDTLRTMNKPFGIIINRAGCGDKGVYDYLNETKFDLLAEIPFSMDMARLYSEGRIPVEGMPELDVLFRKLVLKIEEKWR